MQSILITGCSTGIGWECARQMAEKGWQVFATARKQEDVQKLSALHPNIAALQLDVDSDESIAQAVAQIAQITGGRLDVLFNNAGYGQPGAVEDIPRAALMAQFNTNVFGAWAVTNAVLPLMRAQGGGKVIFNSSVLGFAVLPYRGAYNASKFALEGMADTLRLELCHTPIHVSLIQPGPIVSRFRQNGYAHFLRHIQSEASVHHAAYEGLKARLLKEGVVAPYTLPESAVFDVLWRIIQSKNPKARYRVTFPTHLFYWAKRLLPSGLFERFTQKLAKY